MLAGNTLLYGVGLSAGVKGHHAITCIKKGLLDTVYLIWCFSEGLRARTDASVYRFAGKADSVLDRSAMFAEKRTSERLRESFMR